MSDEDIAYVAYMDEQYAAFEREHAEAIYQEQYEKWAEQLREDDPEADTSEDAYMDWCEGEAERRDEYLAESVRNPPRYRGW